MATVWLIRLLPSPSASSPVLPIAAPWGPPGRPHWLWDSSEKKKKTFEKTSGTHGHASILSHNKKPGYVDVPKTNRAGVRTIERENLDRPITYRKHDSYCCFCTLSVRNLQLP